MEERKGEQQQLRVTSHLHQIQKMLIVWLLVQTMKNKICLISDNMSNAAATSSVLHIDGLSLFDSGSETDSEFLGFEI